ncbi:hypothetical protein Mapa_007305 [Marchantia paleacea]|nr:hypothetical protein Mapa_007305 [Marchantia paleacea]
MTRCPFGGQRIATHDAIRDVVFAMAREGGYLTLRERWYALQSTRVRGGHCTWFGEDQVTVADVVVTDPTRDTVSEGVITHLPGWATSGAAAAKVSKYRGMQRGHLFVPLALELYGAMDTDFDMFVRECARAYHTRRHGVSLSLASCIAYFRQRVSIALREH